MFFGKMKALTFSYDDGVEQDIRLIQLFNKYGLKCTFNINSGLLGKREDLVRDGVTIHHNMLPLDQIKDVYRGHEIAAHTVTHPNLTHLTDKNEMISQVEEDRLALTSLLGYDIVGMAYPGGRPNFTPEIAELLRQNTPLRYARTTLSTYSFDLQTDLMQFRPTVYHHREMDEMFRLGEAFLKAQPTEPMLFYVWGHAYEFDIRNDWDRMEQFCAMMAGHDDIFYGTNRECLLGE